MADLGLSLFELELAEEQVMHEDEWILIPRLPNRWSSSAVSDGFRWKRQLRSLWHSKWVLLHVQVERKLMEKKKLGKNVRDLGVYAK